MSVKLPREIDYASKPSSLPQGTSCINTVVVPSNGSSFNAATQDVIIFDLPSRGYLVPSSMYIRYKLTTSGYSGATSIRGTPYAALFSKLETLIGSQVVESINQYGQLINMLVNLKMNNSAKAGMAAAFGYADSATASSVALTNVNCNGRLMASTAPDNSFLSGPLGCLFSNADKLIPLKHMAGCRIQLTMDALANIFYAVTTTPTGAVISNMELCFDLIDFPSDVDVAVASMVDNTGKIHIKSQSYISSGQTLASGSLGSLELIYNYRLASIKSLFLNQSGVAGTSLNKAYDSFDCTANNGSYQFFVASMPYPQRPLSTIQNRAGILVETASALGPAHDVTTNNLSVTPATFAYVVNGTTTIAAPAQFWVATNTERISSNGVMLSGVSSQNSPISVRLDIGTATAAALTLQLIALYDAIIEVDVANKQVSLLQ